MTRSAILITIGMPASAALGAAETQAPSPAEILASVRQATGAECESEGSITVAGKSGSLEYVENLSPGANVSRTDIPDLGVHQAHGLSLQGSWQQDKAGDIRLLPGGDPRQGDDLYLTGHGYWRPNFGCAIVHHLDPASEQGATYERLQFQVPRGGGFTL